MPDQKNGIFKRALKALQNVYFVWIILLIDVILLLWAMVIRPQVFQYTWAKVLMLVAAAKAVLVFLGIAENERLKNPYKDLNEFLLNPFSWSAVLLFSVLFWVAIVSLELNPPALSISLKAIGGSTLSQSDVQQTGYMEVRKVGDTDVFAGRVSLDTTIIISYVDVYAGYDILVKPDDPDAYVESNERIVTNFGKTDKRLLLAPKRHLVRFVLTPLDATLSIDDTLRTSNLVELTKGTYRYEVRAPHFIHRIGYLEVPQGLSKPYGTITIELFPETVQATFYADRGIGKKRIPIDGIITLSEGTSIFADGLHTGAPIRIPIGRPFTAKILAKGAWDLSSRKYLGETSFVFNDSATKRELWIKVVEQF